MAYIVVFECTKQSGGLYGNRGQTVYENKAEFEALYKEIPEEVVLEKGVSEKRAAELLFSVPEVCWLTGAVEKLFLDTESIVSEAMAEHVLRMTQKKIYYCRAYRKEHSLPDPVIPDDFFDHLLKLAIGKGLKANYMAKIVLYCSSRTGKLLTALY